MLQPTSFRIALHICFTPRCLRSYAVAAPTFVERTGFWSLEAEARLVEIISQGAGQSLDVGTVKIRNKICCPAQNFMLDI